MIDWDKPIETIDGTPVRILCLDRDDPDYPVVALVTQDGKEKAAYYDRNGRLKGSEVTRLNLVNVSETRTVWICVYADGGISVHDDEAAARIEGRERVALKRVDYREGDDDGELELKDWGETPSYYKLKAGR